MRPTVVGARSVCAVGAAGELGDERRQVGLRGLLGAQAAPLQKGAELLQVGAISLERVARKPALELEVGEEIAHQALGRARRRRALRCGHTGSFAPGASPPRSCNQAFRRRSSQNSAISVFASRHSSIAASSRAIGHGTTSMRSSSPLSALSSCRPVAQ